MNSLNNGTVWLFVALITSALFVVSCGILKDHRMPIAKILVAETVELYIERGDDKAERANKVIDASSRVIEFVESGNGNSAREFARKVLPTELRKELQRKKLFTDDHILMVAETAINVANSYLSVRE